MNTYVGISAIFDKVQLLSACAGQKREWETSTF